jgi:hypothetical protein
VQKKSILLILAIILLSAAGFVLYLWIQSGKKTTSEALRAIPIDAAIVVKINPFGQLHQQLYNNNEFWSAMKGFRVINEVNQIFSFADSLKNRSTVFQQMVLDNQVILSAHVVGNGRAEILLLANIPERLKATDVWGLLNDVYGSNQSFIEKDYNGIPIRTYTKLNRIPESNLFVAVHRGVVMVSQSLLLVESAVGQMSSDISLLNDASFVDILKTAGTRVVANVFVNHSKLPGIFAQHIHQNYRKGFQNLSKVGQWTELDLSIRGDFFFLNGFGQANDSLSTFYRVFEKQKPVTMKVTEILPAQTVALAFLGISDLNTYFISYNKYLEGNGLRHSYKQSLDRVNKQVGTDLTALYKSIFSSELAVAFIPFEGLSATDCWYVAAHTKGQSLAAQELIGVIESYVRKNGQSLSMFEKVFAVDREKSVKIFRFPVSGMHRALFGSLFSEVNDQYFTFIDSYIIFGSSVETLSRLVLANVHNKQLDGDPNFKKFSEGLALESNFTAYLNPGKAEAFYKMLLTKNSASALISQIDVAQKIQGVGIQLTGGRAMIFNNIYARYTPLAIDAPQTVWETKLDTTFGMKPQLVINHNTQQREIFVQDRKNNIYLINEVGRVLWKQPLQEPIIGEVNQIDNFRNGKFQYLFNTKNYLFLVDRNGNNVEGFPVKFRSPATNPVAVFDYESNRDYRFFVAAEDRKIYVYDRSGKVIPGWDFDRTEKVITKQLQHFRISNRDYIVMADENRPYILDRKGNERVRPSRYFSQATNSTFALDNNSPGASTRFVTTDSLGFVRFIYLNGKVEELGLKKFSSSHTFDFQDINGDGLKDYIILDGNQLFVFRNNGKELFSQKFSHALLPQTIYFHFSARDRKLGVTCLETSEIFLINGDGSLYKGFPLRGITPFSIGQFANTKTTFNLIVGSSAGFVLNYAVY